MPLTGHLYTTVLGGSVRSQPAVALYQKQRKLLLYSDAINASPRQRVKAKSVQLCEYYNSDIELPNCLRGKVFAFYCWECRPLCRLCCCHFIYFIFRRFSNFFGVFCFLLFLKFLLYFKFFFVHN